MARLGISLHAISVRRGSHWALREVTWRLEPGERWALLGHNGAGKTQLLKVLAGEVWPTPTSADATLEFRLGRRALTVAEAKERVAYVGAELQDKYVRYGWNLAVRDLIATGLHRTDLLLEPVTRAQARRVAAIMSACGLTRHAGREFLTLSYGTKRIALLARALGARPDWLMLDELFNGLDREHRGRIEAILERARRAGQSWVATAHRAADVLAGTGRVLTLESGRVTANEAWKARTRRALAARAAETGAPLEMLERLWGADSAARTDSGRARAGGVAVPSKASGKPLIRLRGDLYVEHRKVLEKLEWELRSGEHWAIFGANGAGKSSFLKLIYGDLSPALGGLIERRGHPHGTPIAEWKRRIGWVSPELHSDYAVDVSLRDLVASGRHSSIGLVDAPSAADRRAARRWLEHFDLSGLAERRPREVSYGELRRALIARALCANPRLLLLDEPLTGLDPDQRRALKRMLERLMPRVTMVIAVHHPEDLPRGVTHALLLRRRRARAAGYNPRVMPGRSGSGSGRCP